MMSLIIHQEKPKWALIHEKRHKKMKKKNVAY